MKLLADLRIAAEDSPCVAMRRLSGSAFSAMFSIAQG
jgi:hypothetical protein